MRKNNKKFCVKGFRAGAVSSGIKKNGKKDLAVIISECPAETSGVFTRNRVKAAPVLYDMERIKSGVARGVIINSGNANASTGSRGMRDAKRMAETAEYTLNLKRASMLVASTGVIGAPLPVEKIVLAAPGLMRNISEYGWMDAAEAIMTTDAFPKIYTKKAKIGGKTITVTGIAKGAGMICPDMATMLAFFATDANIKNPHLKTMLKSSVERSFNSITVDGDTSTNDTVLIFANGACGGGEIKKGTKESSRFQEVLDEAAITLSRMIVRDGEGATKFITIEITGAKNNRDAEKGARTVAGSFLVKTAFFGGDPNWGRIIAALGRSGMAFVPEKVDIDFNGVKVVKNGLDTGMERVAAKAIKKKDIHVRCELKHGRGSSKLWTTDLSYDYIRINSSYRT